MTRGQIAIITDGGIMTSIEFNGDMYLDGGHGEDAINSLKNSTDIATYQYEVAKFNMEHHHYNDCDRLTYELGEQALDFTKDYFDIWFSDYIYIKNLKKEIAELITETRDENDKITGTKKVKLAPNEIAVLCFGKLKKRIK